MASMTAPAHRDESADEYSDLASAHSETDTKKQRRKHQRGGRKASYEEPTPDETAGLLGPEDSPETQNYDEDEDDTCQYCSRKPREPKIQPRRSIPEPFETGIRAFNVRKAAGGRRPVGVRATSDKKKSKPTATRPPTKRTTSSSKSDDAGYETQSQGSSSKSRNDVDESEEQNEEEEGPKPMSIRLDLDLMIEVFLKAKIKGAVTITFQE